MGSGANWSGDGEVAEATGWVGIVKDIGFPIFISVSLLFIFYKLMLPMRQEVGEMRALIAMLVQAQLSRPDRRVEKDD